MPPLTYGKHLKIPYPWRVLSDLDNDLSEVITNPRKAQKKWSHMSRVMGQEGVEDWMSGTFYLEVV